MNLITVDIGNTNITVGLFLKDEEQSVTSFAGSDEKRLAKCFKDMWAKIPIVKSSKEKKTDGVIVVCSVKPAWTDNIRKIVKDVLDERILLIGQEIPFPINMSVQEPGKTGTDRILGAAAAYAVVEAAVVVADFGTAVTIDLVDDRGIFCGGVISPGFEISAKALNENTAQLPKVKVTRPKLPFGKNTAEAVNAGIYYSAIGMLQEVIRRYAEKIGTWPQTVITGTGAKIIKDDCQFIDSFVPNLVTKGIALAYQKYIEDKS